MTTFAGSEGPGLVNGNSMAAKFNNPFGIAVHHATGDIYVSEYSNHCIRKITSESSYILIFDAKIHFNDRVRH